MSLEAPGDPWRFQGGVLGVPGGAPGAPKPPREASVNPAGLRGGGKEVAPGLIRGGSGPPLKLLAKAKSDENERRQKVRDLTRPGPAARRIYIFMSIGDI